MRQVLGVAMLSVLAVTVAVMASAAPADKVVADRAAAFEEVTPASQKAIDRGLAYLASVQAADGSWYLRGGRGNTGITGLAGLAFLTGGVQPGRGKYGENLTKAVDYVLKHTRMDGFITSGKSRMYEHGFATLFLAEVYGMTRNPKVKDKLTRAVGLIEGTQSPQGGWRYNPVPLDADISVTVCQIMALRAARNSGIQVKERVIKNGIKYIKYCQTRDGGFGYTGPRNPGFARTAAGVCSLYYAGEYDDKDKSIKRGLDYLHGTSSKGNRHMRSYFFYANYYATQAMFQAGGKYWQSYFPKIRDQIVRTQQADGSWKQGNGGVHYATAMACIILQVPYRYLPVLQR